MSPDPSEEQFEELLRWPNVRIERIVSRGHANPEHRPHLQDWDEWVMVIQGEAGLRLDGGEERHLRSGDHMLIPAGVAHWVTYTADPTIWLAVHAQKA